MPRETESLALTFGREAYAEEAEEDAQDRQGRDGHDYVQDTAKTVADDHGQKHQDRVDAHGVALNIGRQEVALQYERNEVEHRQHEEPHHQQEREQYRETPRHKAHREGEHGG